MLIEQETRAVFQKNVKRLLDARGKSALWLSTMTGDNRSTVYSALNGDRDVGIGLLVRIASALNVSADKLLPVRLITSKANCAAAK